LLQKFVPSAAGGMQTSLESEELANLRLKKLRKTRLSYCSWLYHSTTTLYVALDRQNCNVVFPNIWILSSEA